MARRAGFDKKISPHSLRHSLITAPLDAGVPLNDIEEAASTRSETCAALRAPDRPTSARPIGDRALGPRSIIASETAPVRATDPAKCGRSERDRPAA
ncbi:MAG: hypothetical protein ACSLE8_23645 [Rhodococcus sp. (in: high G+C Gram-positive bacteria)]